MNQRNVAVAVAVTLSLAVLLGCAPEPAPLDDNHFPTARLVAPQIVVAGDAAVVDAAGSDDEDGDALEFTFSFGDGSPEAVVADPVFAHVWSAPGTVAVSVRVVDEQAFVSRAEVAVVVVDGVAEECSCALPCEADGLCTGRGCLLFASADDDDVARFDDAVSCE